MKLFGHHIVTDRDLSRMIQDGAASLTAERRANEAALLAAVREWRDAREPCLEGAWEGDHTVQGKAARLAKWERFSKAQSVLMALARRLGPPVGRKIERLAA